MSQAVGNPTGGFETFLLLNVILMFLSKAVTMRCR
jgi:hypothetical protein